ncbi:hypothetical protein M406DRAFT_330008 [Cryphonectria parasitica EP155]|uniref:2EXR domain-containing protein n=1 Tax=Cryphonectria parasitica (strain ATCC 38755 / EP155) TaxID=660469 RepID=A0A9P4Y484_CRYP1|nr:uncharacterized protein M406DRAFT_330008 [Cryphonectria parasitica EP155]KAF3766169.1 hypothetical protein M406DRAFT_330008 [Cryphonectria parasitica EP155]
MASLLNTFPQFSLLPAELQLQIWESAAATQPSMHMHMFDVHAPSSSSPPPTQTTNTAVSNPLTRKISSHRRSRSRCSSSGKVRKPSASPPRKLNSNIAAAAAAMEQEQQPEAGAGVSIQAFDMAPDAAAHMALPGARPFTSDPSMYRFRNALRATCTDAAGAVARAQAAVPVSDRAVVELPGGGRIAYNNAADVLHLRFLTSPVTNLMEPDSDSAMDIDTPLPTNTAGSAPLSAIFRSCWSRELAAALHGARRVAIDVSQIWPELAEQQHRLVQDVVFLVCTLQNDLEVLYLVDYSAGRYPRAGAGIAKELMGREGGLYRALHSRAGGQTEGGDWWERELQRKGDVIHGADRVWREVFDLEKLGWHERHPAFVFAEMFGEVVRLQQGNWFGEGQKQAAFKGVRVLVAEDK